MTMSDLPVPETTTLMLMSERLERFTKHEYVATEEVVCKPHAGFPGGHGYAFMFRCTETGVIRRCGLEKAL